MSETSPARTSSRSRSLKYILMLGALAALPAVTTDMYLPALPEVASDLATTTTAAQFTLSGTLLGTAVGQLVIGPLSDRFGRRLPLLIGISMHVVTSLLCAIAPNIGLLIGLRIMQGFFNAAASVVAIAVIRDRFTGSDAARLLSRLMLMIGLAPLLAPTLGQAVAGIWAWRAVFYALALIGVILVVIVWRWMPETLPPERRLTKAKKGTPKSGKPGGYRILLRDRRFLAFAVIPGLSMGIIMSYVVGSPFVMQEEYGLSPAAFALIFAVNGVAMVVSSQVNASLLNRYPSAGILRIAAPVLLVLAVILPIIIATGFGGVVGLVAGLWVVLGMLGFIFSNATSLALDGYGHMAGTAAALLGCLQVGLAGLISPLVGVFGGSALSMAGVIIGCALAINLVLATTPAYRRGGRRLGTAPQSTPAQSNPAQPDGAGTADQA
ncbi:multidrug effflux MFS transporter [Arthrobacter citreus]|uniref:multidrug effflux MFS transporter n=1 Tax=Arthrobacter citreus TaxID=1670 RepID=UPI0036DA5A31